jgi:hypothetical protein
MQLAGMQSFVQLHGQRYAAAALVRCPVPFLAPPPPPHTPAGRLVLEPARIAAFFLRESELTSVRHSHVFLLVAVKGLGVAVVGSRGKDQAPRDIIAPPTSLAGDSPKGPIDGDIVLYACRVGALYEYSMAPSYISAFRLQNLAVVCDDVGSGTRRKKTKLLCRRRCRLALHGQRPGPVGTPL